MGRDTLNDEPAFIEELREISDYLGSNHVKRGDLAMRLDQLIEDIVEHYEFEENA